MARYACIAALAALAGCGTMNNLNGVPQMPTPTLKPQVEMPSVFGGVNRDLGLVVTGPAVTVSFLTTAWSEPPERVFNDLAVLPQVACVSLAGVADLPLSLVGDVVTLPVVWWSRQPGHEDTAATPPAQVPQPPVPGP